MVIFENLSNNGEMLKNVGEYIKKNFLHSSIEMGVSGPKWPLDSDFIWQHCLG